MKIIINYDFFNAILDVNEKLTPMKIVRNNKKLLIKYCSMFFLLNYGITRSIPRCLFILMFQSSGFFAAHYVHAKNDDTDIYKKVSIIRLIKLVSDLKDQNINTDYDSLLNSELLERKYKVQLNENKIPELMEEKYILVPTNDFNNNIKNVSIKQEHIIGSTDYVLSIGSPKKELKLAYSNLSI